MTNLVISPQWLFEHLDDAKVVIVDCRFSLNDPQWGENEYKANHIPGAFYLGLNQDLSSQVQKHGGRHPLPNVEKLGGKLSSMGIDGDTLVVAYDSSRFAFASRLWWLLRYLGHEKVAVLDGGFSGWLAAGYSVTTELPSRKPAVFIPQVQGDKAVDIEYVKKQKYLANFMLVDSREPARYRGETEPIDPVAGHIPGAVNFPWQEVTNNEGMVRPVDEQKGRWEKAINADEIVVYCGSGVTACVNLLSLEMAGVKNAKLYAGSWSDWCSYLI
ncbi:sulfurtransferase [Ancylothrix sp. C2]|uniref:sulfurtransferase n=1 Tax=Ancylothrix sp. D3o TaxID=2953691 RepID=UPI0021BAA8C9|nr:sulfurtransferase [Ancylothrix sp. D3o]MCT7951555.1 sulfurtransferase [Ancylothrix sp. D3o]